MYKLHLILKYLRKRRIAWVALLAVMLCTTMVIVVISVMGGWLRMFRTTYHSVTGDIVISRRGLNGFAHYQEMIDRMEKMPEVDAAMPVLKTYGLIKVKQGTETRFDAMVEVMGLQMDKIHRITGFRDSLYRQHQQRLEMADEKGTSSQDAAHFRKMADEPASFEKPLLPNDYKSVLPKSRVDVTRWPGMIVGGGVIGVRKARTGGVTRPSQSAEYTAWVQLTVLAAGNGGSLDLANDQHVQNFWIVDDSRMNIGQLDSNTVYVPFEVLQADIGMDEQSVTDAATGEKKTQPARASEIHVALKPGTNLAESRAKIQLLVDQIAESNTDDASLEPIIVATWEEFNADFLGAVEKEKVLLTFLFAIVSVVAMFLIFCIFFMIVAEKTKDIGIIKSVGATNSGVAVIFLGYGLAIGIVGALMGLGCGYLIVHNINFLHEEMGKLMGIQIWTPDVYLFDTIPDTMNPPEVAVIMTVAIIASVFGAIVPAIRAARLHPVEALRWE